MGRRHPSRAMQLSAACRDSKLPSTAVLGSRLQAAGGGALCDPGKGSPPAHGHRWARSRHPTKAPLSPGPRVLLISLGLSARENIHAVLQLEVVLNLPFRERTPFQKHLRPGRRQDTSPGLKAPRWGFHHCRQQHVSKLIVACRSDSRGMGRPRCAPPPLSTPLCHVTSAGCKGEIKPSMQQEVLVVRFCICFKNQGLERRQQAPCLTAPSGTRSLPTHADHRHAFLPTWTDRKREESKLPPSSPQAME